MATAAKKEQRRTAGRPRRQCRRLEILREIPNVMARAFRFAQGVNKSQFSISWRNGTVEPLRNGDHTLAEPGRNRRTALSALPRPGDRL